MSGRERKRSRPNSNPNPNDDDVAKGRKRKANTAAVVLPEEEEDQSPEPRRVTRATNRKPDAAAAAGCGIKRPVKTSSEMGRALMEDATRKKAKTNNAEWHRELCRMCHQCQRSDKERIVRCSKCTTRRYCVRCIERWYPNMKEDDFAEACSFCRGFCNCKACLREKRPDEKLKLDLPQKEAIEHANYLVHKLYPYLKQFHAEQTAEKKVEADFQGAAIGKETIKRAECSIDERMYCDNCKTSIADIHRSCDKCSYDLCLACCRDIRIGQLRSCGQVVIEENPPNDRNYYHGDMKKIVNSIVELTPVEENPEFLWELTEDGKIPCPPTHMGGCSNGFLQLRCLFENGLLSKLVKKGRDIAEQYQISNPVDDPLSCPCHCSKGSGGIRSGNNLTKAACRVDSSDNYLYNPKASEIQPRDLLHFQYHWRRGEPVIVGSALDSGTGLSWDPLVMWRAVRQISHREHGCTMEVSAIDCLDLYEIYILTHTADVAYKESERKKIDELKQKHREQDLMEGIILDGDQCTVLDLEKAGKARENPEELDEISGYLATSENTLEAVDGGAVWNIFRRKDVPKLQEYLKKHFREFRDIYCYPLRQVKHPVHDQTFYLSQEHKRMLKEEYGIEPWTFVQKLGDAVFIPAGCPYQVRNKKSCIKVAMDFVSAENVGECIRLAEEFRKLPNNHIAKEDKLEVRKMMVYAMAEAIKYLEVYQNVESEDDE